MYDSKSNFPFSRKPAKSSALQAKAGLLGNAYLPNQIPVRRTRRVMSSGQLDLFDSPVDISIAIPAGARARIGKAAKKRWAKFRAQAKKVAG